MRVLYCLAGEGMGHCTRSLEIVRHLSKKHKVRVLASGVSFRFLNNKLKGVYRILGYNLVYRRNRLSFFLTALLNVVKWPFVELYNLKFIKHMIGFKPDIIISDFEPYASWWGLITGKPVLTIDNQHIVKADLNVGNKVGLFFLRFFISLYIPKRSRSLALSFFSAKSRDKRTVVVPPVLRKDVLDARPVKNDFIMVYQTSRDYDRLLPILHLIDEEFVIPDSKHRGKVQNVTFQGFSEKNFLDDLSRCKALITNGGFSLISEALYLKKPILSEPIRGQFEQYINAYYIQKLGFGRFCKKIGVQQVRDFVSNLNLYKRNLDRNYRQVDNDKFFKILDKTLDSLK